MPVGFAQRFDKGMRPFGRSCGVLFVAGVLAFASGCSTFKDYFKPHPAGPKTTAEQPEVSATPVAIPPGVVDLKAVAGRRICLDPGHGGPWPGAVAPSNGLREADVNLRVALTVEKMLRDAGAEVITTREKNTALVPDSLGDDLAARAKVGTDSKVDAFISIHHNSDIEKGSPKNDLEVYYKLGDNGTSLDLAQNLIGELAAHLGDSATARQLLPGNYKVLRLSKVPAVLLESSYVTEPKNAAFMATDAGIAREAQAIATGIARYFALDPPKLADAGVSQSDDGTTQQVRIRFARGFPIDMETVRIVRDGVAARGSLEPAEAGFTWTSGEVLPNGVNTLRLIARNIHGAGIDTRIDVHVARPAARIDVRQVPETVSESTGVEVLLEARAYDALGMPCADGDAIACAELNQSATIRNGVANFYAATPKAGATFTLKSGGATMQHAIHTGDDRFRTIRVLDAKQKKPIRGVTVASQGRVVGITTDEGWIAVPMNADEIRLSCARFDTKIIRLQKPRTEVLMTAAENGDLAWPTIVIDAAYGGRDPGVAGPKGARSSDYSLDVARRLAALLTNAGATVYLTRDGDEELSEPSRVSLTETHDAELVVSISFGSRIAAAKTLDDSGYQRADLSAYVGHYPKSEKGEDLATAIGKKIGATATPSVAYLVQQTPCTAVLVQPASITDAAAEEQYAQPSARSKVAHGIYEGIAAYVRASSAKK